MLLFKITRSDKKNNIYIQMEKNYDAMKNMTLSSIVGKRFKYSEDGIDYTVNVKCVDSDQKISSTKNIYQTGDMKWMVESLIKFGKIISPKEQRKIREQKLMNL